MLWISCCWGLPVVQRGWRKGQDRDLQPWHLKSGGTTPSLLLHSLWDVISYPKQVHPNLSEVPWVVQECGIDFPVMNWWMSNDFISRWQGAAIDWNGTDPILWLIWPALSLGRPGGNDWMSTFLFPPIQEIGQFEMRKNDKVYRLAEFHLSHLVLQIFCLQYKQHWRKFLVTAFSIKLLRAGWVPTTKSRLQMKQWSRQHPLEVSFWIHSVSCNCLEASNGRCWT